MINTEFLAVILGGGTAAVIAAIVQAWKSVKDGARIQEKDAFADLEKSRRTETGRREWAEAERDYWHTLAGIYEYVIRTLLPPDKMPQKPPFPEKPKEVEDQE